MNTPNKDQKRLLKELDKFHRSDSKHIFTYSGPPGSGKTWVIGLFFEKNHIKSDEYITCAYSGKAANVLAMRGLPARTIHSLIMCTLKERNCRMEHLFTNRSLY